MITVDPIKKREIYLSTLKPLSRRQFKLILLENGLLNRVDEIIDSIEDEQFRMRIKIEYEDSATFERMSQTIAQLYTMMGLKESQVDEMWEAALKL